jgi:hypothetical protein
LGLHLEINLPSYFPGFGYSEVGNEALPATPLRRIVMTNGNAENDNPDEKAHLEQVKLLFDYTKFHIGLYTTLASVLIAALGASFAKEWQIHRELVAAAIVLIALAGLFGGVVASSLPYISSKASLHPGKELYEQPIGPLWTDQTNAGKLSCLAQPVRYWTYLEHSAFWAAVLLLLIAFLPVACDASKRERGPTSVEVTGYENVKVTR